MCFAERRIGEGKIEARADLWHWLGRAAPPRRSAAWVLRRRGMTHGWIRRGPVRRLSGGEAKDRWRRADPVHLRAATPVGDRRRALARTSAMFSRLRSGGSFEREIWSRCPPTGEFVPAGVSVDVGDVREIEKVHADRRRGGRTVSRDLWAKLSWISFDPRDESIRIRFSFGSEHLDDWRSDAARARASDGFARSAFPECALLDRNRGLERLVSGWIGRRFRLSERIVFMNAPQGGATFHHDAEEGQLGVVYAQLTGRTAWLALSKRALAREVAALAGGALARLARSPSATLRALDRPDLPSLDRLLNRSPRLTARLVRAGALYVLQAGDVLLLPSHGPDDAAWHSVFALGERAGLAHSYGIFPGRRR